MTVFDYAVLTIVGLSVLLSVIRGLVREVLALLAWVAAFVAASLFGGRLAALLPTEIPSGELRLLAAFIGIFFAVLLAMGLLAVILSRLVRRAGLSVEDRILGGLFGMARGLVIVMVLVLAAGLTALPKNPEWRNALFSSPLETAAMVIRHWMPADVAKRINYR